MEPHFVQQEPGEPADEDGAQGAADEDAEDGGHERVLRPAAVLLILWGAGRYQAVHLVHGQRCQRGLHRCLQTIPGDPGQSLSAWHGKAVCRCSQKRLEQLPEQKGQILQACQTKTQSMNGMVEIFHSLD